MSKLRVKLWLAMGGFLGVAAMPCPECGSPMILHAWPLVGLVLIARTMKNYLRGTGPAGPATRPADTDAPVSVRDREDPAVEIRRMATALGGHGDGFATTRQSKEASNGQR